MTTMTVSAKNPAPFDGMRVIDMRYVNLDQITTLRGQNSARACGPDLQKIAQFRKIINSGGYEPFYHEPPTVVLIGTDSYELVNGDHRFQGHLNASKTEMWVAIVEFDSEISCGQYKVAANVGSDDNIAFVKNDRTDDDIVKAVTGLMQKYNIKATEANVRDQLSAIRATNRKTLDIIISKILKNFNVKVETIQTYGEKTAPKRFLEISKKTNSKVICSTVRDNSRDQQWRVVFKAFEHYVENGVDAPVDLVMSVNKQSTAVGVNRVRASITKDVSELFDWIAEFANIVQSKEFKRPSITFLPQTEKEVLKETLVVRNV